MRKPKTPAATQTRTLYVEDKKGAFKITIPATSKVTFGKLHGNTDKANYGDGNCLRIYEAENRQLAVFTNVIMFRDVALPIQRQVLTTANGTRINPNVKTQLKEEVGVDVQESWVEVDADPMEN
jgi:hypothetical protein